MIATDDDKREEGDAESGEETQADSAKHSGTPPPGLVWLHEVYLPFLSRLVSSPKPFVAGLAFFVSAIILCLIFDWFPRWLPVVLLIAGALYMGLCIHVALMTSTSDGAVWVKKYRELHPHSKSDPKPGGPPDSNQSPETINGSAGQFTDVTDQAGGMED